MTIRKPIFVRPLDLGQIVAGSARDGHSVFNLNRADAIGLTWKTDGAGSAWARGQFAAAQSIDFCALMAANALPGTTIRLRLGATQAEVDGSAPYDSTALPFIAPARTDPDGLYHSHLEISSPVTALWWRIDIGGHTGDFEASTLVLGRKIEPSRYYNFEFERGFEDLGEASFTRFGVIDDQDGLVFRTIGFTLGWVNEAEFEASFAPLIKDRGRRKPVFLCFDPEPTAYRQSKTYLGLMRKPPFARGIRKPGTYTMDFELLSMV